ncbi:MAG: transposase [Spirochaetaceae bacterium]|jgi:REP element-mobilizing transposase RayT|nr:transposase [Spirochaetaceae bacterium]
MSSHNLPRGLTNQGLTYHVSSEVNRYAFELEPDDMKELFLIVIKEAIKKGFKFKLWNFCIMDNHFHFLITPEKGQSLSEILKWIKMVFAIRWNKKHNKTGHFWGDRFYSREIKDEKDFWNVYNYIDQNPVAAGLVQQPEEWQYSGAYQRKHGITRIISLITDTTWKTDLKLLSF